jgi:hypothetical protein
MISSAHKLTIKSNASWLQEAPRSTWEIIMKLFPDMIPRAKEIPKAAVEVADLLFGVGYVPVNGIHNLAWDLLWEKVEIE